MGSSSNNSINSTLFGRVNMYVAKAREIVIIGYSFPPTDFATEALLRDDIPWQFQRQTLFVIMTPQREVFERFEKTFGSSEVEWKISLKEYLDAI